MNKEEIKVALLKRPDKLKKEELSELFGIFCLSIKEYGFNSRYLYFEVHYRRIYLIRIRYSLNGCFMTFENEYISLTEDSHGVAMKQVENTGELLQLFLNMFYHNLLADANYKVYYNEELSIYASQEEAIEYFEYTRALI